MKNLTLSYNHETKPLANWGIAGLVRTVENLGGDVLEITLAKEKTLPFKAEEKIILFEGERRVFEGIITAKPLFAKADGEWLKYTVCGPFWYLENLVYKQTWGKALGEDSLSKSRVVLGQGEAGEPLNADDQVKAIVDYATSCGAPLQLGAVDLTGAFFPQEETRNLTCAQAIFRILRWVPDAVLWVDYEGEGLPKLCIKRRELLEKKLIDLNVAPIKALTLKARHDLQVKGVVLEYEKLHRLSGDSFLTVEKECYPEGVSSRQFKVMVLTLELEGVSGYAVTQEVRVRPIQPHTADFWKAHLPGLSHVEDNKLQIEDIARTTDLPYELTEGAICPWMMCKVKDDIVSATLRYETQEGMVLEHPVAVKVRATDAQSKIYEDFRATKVAQELPVGLAKTLYEAFSPLYYEGEITMPLEEKSEGYLGKVVKLLAEETCESLVQGVTYDWEKETLTLKLGLPTHLGLEDYAELMRVNRQRAPLSQAPSRALGKVRPLSKIEQTAQGPLGKSDRGWGRVEKWVLHEKAQERICLDAKAVPSGSKVTLREESVCENGLLLKRLVLASDPY